MVIRGSLVPDGPDGVGAGQRRQGRRAPSSRNQDSSPCTEPGKQRDTPDVETSDWRAVCGRTARTVRREGRRKPSLPLSVVRLDADYFDSLTKHAVPLDSRAVAALAHSALDLDVYTWLAQRL